MGKLGVNSPPEQATMSKLFGASPPDLRLLKEQGVTANQEATGQVEVKTYDVTNTCESIQTCLCTCGMAGLTTATVELREDMMVLTEKNNLDDTNIQMPYAQMGSVDYTKSCCCCYSVNDMSPGCGCDDKLVAELSEELQSRKVKRGNIAQIKQLEAMQSTTCELDCQLDLILEREGIQYPPPQETVSRLYGTQVPRVLTSQPAVPHIEAAKQFETKTYNVTDKVAACCGLLCCPCCGWTTKTMELGAEEMFIVTQNLCIKNNERTPYAQLGAVEVETTCCCCIELPELAKPGFGCEEAYVQEIAGELQDRKEKRGNIAQLKMQENMLNEILKIVVKMDLLLLKNNIEYAAPAQMAMATPA
mmetsp:Transcript_48732/g.106470  ORF Transcript_48732/g.106470 Transcript_48732/m.106470 type:complete len:361 (+) Transcript_48732:2-1084(+)